MSNYEKIIVNSLQKQYLYSNVAKLCIEKSKVYSKYVGELTSEFGKQILNIRNCNSSSLDYFWGNIFKITRNFLNKNTREEINLNDEEFREILLLRAFSTNWDGSLASLNLFLKDLFEARGNAFIIDTLNMTTLIFSFNFKLKDWEEYLFVNTNILPRPAGVGAEISIIDNDSKYFGFTIYDKIIESPITTGFKTYHFENEGLIITY